jgi:hypothetical protein
MTIIEEDNLEGNKKKDYIRLHDCSELVDVMPPRLVEPAIVLSKILGYKSVDEYAIDLIRKDILTCYQTAIEESDKQSQKYLGQFL